MVVSVEKKLRTVYRELPVSAEGFLTQRARRKSREEDWWR
jgi:hypothetical protein